MRRIQFVAYANTGWTRDAESPTIAPMRETYLTLNEAKLGQVDDTYYYGASCQKCGHDIRLSLVRLRAHLGDDFPLVDVRKRLKCSACGSRKIIISFFTPAHRNATLADRFNEPAV
jgi:hypothetical protein